MDNEYMAVNDTVKASPVGSGRITEMTPAGYPRVNGVAVAWLIRTDDAVFNPRNINLSEVLSDPKYTAART